MAVRKRTIIAIGKFFYSYFAFFKGVVIVSFCNARTLQYFLLFEKLMLLYIL